MLVVSIDRSPTLLLMATVWGDAPPQRGASAHREARAHSRGAPGSMEQGTLPRSEVARRMKNERRHLAPREPSPDRYPSSRSTPQSADAPSHEHHHRRHSRPPSADMSSAERERAREERRARRHSQQRASRRVSRREAPQETRPSAGTRQRRAAAGAAGYARYEPPERDRYASPRRERYASPDEERYESADEDPYGTPQRLSLIHI